jgi:hypothetical protein
MRNDLTTQKNSLETPLLSEPYNELHPTSYINSIRRCLGAGELSGMVLGYGVDDRGVRIPAGAGNFFLHHRVQTGSGAHPSSYPVVTAGSFPGDKAAGREANH